MMVDKGAGVSADKPRDFLAKYRKKIPTAG